MSATQHSGRSSSAAIGMPGSFAIPTGVALTMPSARLARRGKVRYDLDLVRAATARQKPRCQRSARSPCDIAYQKPLDAAFQQGVGHRSAGAAGAQEQHRRMLLAGQPAAKALLEAPHVGVVAYAPTALEHDGVDRAEDLGRLRKLVEQRDDLLLVGKGHVEAVKPKCSAKAMSSPKGGAASPIVSVSSSV